MQHAQQSETKTETVRNKPQEPPVPEREAHPRLSISGTLLTAGASSGSPNSRAPAGKSRGLLRKMQRTLGNQAVLRMLRAPGMELRPSQVGIVQRKCVCGETAGAGGLCAACQKEHEEETGDRNDTGAKVPIQAKLTVNPHDDIYEQEADRVASKVLNTPDTAVAPSIQRAKSLEDGDEEETLQAMPLAASITPVAPGPLGESREEEDGPIQTRSAGSRAGGFEAGDDVESQVNLSKGSGKPLSDPVRAYMEPRFGVDFSDVRVHTDGDALQMNEAIGARAFTHGTDIYYGAGHGPDQLDLTAHELTHVVQQAAAGLTQNSLPAQRREGTDNELERQPGPASSLQELQEEDEEQVSEISMKSFGAGSDEPPEDIEDRRPLGHDLTHLIGQQNVAVNTIQRQAKTVDTPDLVGDKEISIKEDKDGQKFTVLFKDKAWTTITWAKGAAPVVGIESKHNTGTQRDRDFMLLTVDAPSTAVRVTVDRAVENEIIASSPSVSVSVMYQFAFEGDVLGLGTKADDVKRAPLQFGVDEDRSGQHQDTLLKEGEIPSHKPLITRSEFSKNFELPDTYPSFDNIDQLRKFVKAKANKPFLVMNMPDGRFVAREMTEMDIQRIAKAARQSHFGTKQYEQVPRYKGKPAQGSFETLVVDGKEYHYLSELADLYYDNDDAAGIGTPGSSPECEVFRIGLISYGRKPLTHAEAVARWQTMDKQKTDEVFERDVEPDRKFEALWVRGVSKLHKLDLFGYFAGRDAYYAHLQAIEKETDNAKKRNLEVWLPANALKFLMADTDRETDNPALITSLKSYKPGLELLQLHLYQKVAERGQQIAIKALSDAANQIGTIVQTDRTFRDFLYGFPSLKEQQQRDALSLLGVPKEKLDTYKTALKDQQSAFQIGLGARLGEVSLANLREYALQNMGATREVVGKLQTTKDETYEIKALEIKGDFGDHVRTMVYREFGFNSLYPSDFPHRDRSPDFLPSPLAGDRLQFSTTAEQLFVNRAKNLDSKDTIETALKVTAVIAATVVLILAANAAGAAVAGLLFAEGSAGFIATQAVVAGVILTGADVAKDLASGQKITAADTGEKLLWNIGTGVGFGALGKLLKGASTGLRLGAEGLAFLSLSFGQYYVKNKKMPSASESYWMLYENILTFALLQGGATLARPGTERVGLWARAKRLGGNEVRINELMENSNRLNRDLAAFAVKPQRAEAEALDLQNREKALLAEQEALIKELEKSFSTRGDAAQLKKEVQAELDEIRAALAGMEQAKFLSGLDIQAIGESQSVFEYKPVQGAADKFRTFFPDAIVVERPDGTLEVTMKGEQQPFVFVPRGNTPPPPAVTPGASLTGTKININNATAKELTALPGVGQKTADAIVEYRDKNGPFKSVDDLAKVKGIGPQTMAKVLPLATTDPAQSGPSVLEVQKTLSSRQDTLTDRAARSGVSGTSLDAIAKSKLRPLETTARAKLESAEKLLDAAEKTLNDQSKAALDRVSSSKRLGKEGMTQLRGGDILGKMSDLEVGDALVQTKGLKNLGPAELRGVLHAYRAGVSLEKFFDVAKGMPTAERNFVLDTFARLSEGRIPGASRVIQDMGRSAGSWAGGLFAMEVARFDFGIENIAGFEVKIEGQGVRRDYDIILKSGIKVELKNWASWDKEMAESISNQFLNDVRLSQNDPNIFTEHRYIFRDPAPIPATQIKAFFRGELVRYTAKEISAGTMVQSQADALMNAFDAEAGLVSVASARGVGAAPLAPPTPLPPVPGAPALPPDDKDRTKDLPAPGDSGGKKDRTEGKE